MKKVVLDDALRAKLGNLEAEVNVVDESGNKVGIFLSEEAYTKLLYAWAKTQFSEPEAQEAREDYRKNGGYTTAQVLAHLKSLDAPERPTS